MGGGASKPQLYGVSLHLYDLVRRDSLGGLFGDLTGMHALHSGVEIFKAKLDKYVRNMDMYCLSPVS